MLVWFNKQGVRSSKGFSFQRMDRYYYYYVEFNKELKIDVEPLRDKNDNYYEIISLDSIDRWMPPYDQHIIGNAEKITIQNNISEALAFMGIAFKFQENQS